jgi:hypothetical protein
MSRKQEKNKILYYAQYERDNSLNDHKTILIFKMEIIC